MANANQTDLIMKQPDVPFREIKGWGSDLDPKMRPGYPKEMPSDVRNVRGPEIERQPVTVRIHQSIEHPDLTPVFGTTCPPRGLSGKLRDHAYKFSEDRLAHWLTLMLADRVDVVEGMIEDLTGSNHERRTSRTVDDSPAADTRRTALIAGAALAAVAVGIAWQMSRRDRD